ncbi:hypothetical protein [Roseomonas sp. CECT 9278]|uniref:hypothetical protein n=1 Tax=Roseomonas sp. CECT 9278 TaxID=2845823 RepID=UPI001E5652BF|nr:hypothetical protein [Roseomonas sp. CECT 9278]CAH0198484.1 hypothetical protein ROS9278_01863 [Roseomonas sp. CECT 9278]
MAAEDGATTPALDRARRLVGDDLQAQRRVWRLQRLGWAGMIVVVAASAAGLFGAGGPLAGVSTRGATGLAVDYEAVVRRSRATTWTIALPPGADTLVLADPATDLFQPRLVLPRPIDERRVDGGLAMTFHPAAGGRPSVQLSLTPSAPGWHAVRLSAGGSSTLLHIATLP